MGFLFNIYVMKNIKYFSKFNETLSKSDLNDFDFDDISMSLSDWWISVEDSLPPSGKNVLIYLKNDKISIASLSYGISKIERDALKESDPERYRTYSFADEDSNNKVAYRWKENGPGSYFGQEVLYWMPMPIKPEN
jgi:hypothetical protein